MINLSEEIYMELAKLELKDQRVLTLDTIRSKDGIHLYRVKYDDNRYILKYFEKEAYRREIVHYNLLRQLKVPTIKVIASTEASLLLEDIETSDTYRLGVASDLEDVKVARALAHWYISLHEEGAKYIRNNDGAFYKESDRITIANIEMIRDKSNTAHLPVWKLILDKYDYLVEKINSFEATLTYNDFYWTNFVVGHDKEKALMFDYNFLGCGFRYNDIRNVCNSLSEAAGQAFLEAYGPVNEEEKHVDMVMSILFDLIVAYERPVFPDWSKESLEAVEKGKLEEAFNRVINGSK